MGLTYSSVVPAEPDEVFAWHSRPGAITRLMPPWQPVRVAREAPSVRDGQAVLALPGGLRWVAGHDPSGYDPPRQFADVLLPPLGAALHWRHTHQFTPAPAGGTMVVDVVSTPVPAGYCGRCSPTGTGSSRRTWPRTRERGRCARSR